MSSRPKFKPPKARLTLTKEATQVFSKVVRCQFAAGWLCVPRSDGKYDLPVSNSLYDQLQTAALPSENFSDTILRLAAKQA
jgi:hypothetical protein